MPPALNCSNNSLPATALSLSMCVKPRNLPPGHLPGAVNVPLADLPGRAGELAARRQLIVVVCKSNRRSSQAATGLLAAGLQDVAVLRGGTDEWHRQGLALE